MSDFETKVIRGEACFRAALALRAQGFTPDAIVAHHGWGESLFLKDVWPQARLGVYCEFFYHAQGADTGFDPEFPAHDEGEVCRLRLKNLNNLLHFETADAGISPTRWQASTFPEPFRSRITVVHDGIDTNALMPNPQVSLTLNGQLKLTRDDEVVTFVNRNLEPYRGYHVFMRALPQILAQRPRARVLIVGGDDVSYGARPPDGRKWRDIFAAEVRPRISDADWARVHFLGNLAYPAFVALLQLSRVHVYLTYPFVLSWSLLEAMACGAVVVGSATAPVMEVIEDGRNGHLVDFFDREGWLNTLERVLAAPEKQGAIAARARQTVVERYDLRDHCLPRQLELVDQVAALSC